MLASWFRRLTRLSRVGLACLVLALAAVAIPGTGFVRAVTGAEVSLDAGSVHLMLPADRTYGIYADDDDNSGYSERCGIVDADGRQVRLSDPGWSMSSSDTENLDRVFNTGDGDVTISCDMSGATASTRPVPNYTAMLLGGLLAALLGAIGIGLFVSGIPSRRIAPLPVPLG
jgi:hypothetical protein